MVAAKQIDYFGGCPECYGNDGFLNVHSTHWCVCDTHKTRWCVGDNLFSSWREESEETWEANAERLGTYREVTPIHTMVPQGYSDTAAVAVAPAADDEGDGIPF